MVPDEDELEETRSALAPTLDATAAILPWLAKPKELRFPPELAKRWQAVCGRLAIAWLERHGDGLADLRPAVFELCSVALELGDRECLHLTEALASATDCLEAGGLDARLAAALSATFECLAEDNGLEHVSFPERARHFAARLERCSDPQDGPAARSAVLDRLFVIEATECMERMREALAMLPPDPYAMKLAAGDVARQAESLELDDIAAIAIRLNRLLTLRAGEHVDLDASETRSAAESLIVDLEKAIAAI